MIVDERTYTVAAGLLDDYLRHHMDVALPIMREHLGEPLGYYVSETGDLNQFVHLWRYESHADRERRRASLYADARWLAYRRAVGEKGWVRHQSNRLLRAFVPPAAA